ncbi:MAG: DUF4396 domain-containing protein [Acidobacteriota bacterium]
MRGGLSGLDLALYGWFGLTALAFVFVAWDLFARTPEMKIMKWGWLLVILYTGPAGAAVYWFSCREPSPGTHEKFVAPLWKQAIGSTIHCLAGDATGVIAAAILTSRFHLPMGIDVAVEYAVGFAFGLLVFQALFMKGMLGVRYGEAVSRTALAEWLSMNCVMAGMVPVMVILMTRDMRAMEPTSLRFWAVMSFATLVGAVTAYPINRWMVGKGLKHGMGTARVLGHGGTKKVAAMTAVNQPAPMEMAAHSGVGTVQKVAVTFASLVALAAGVALAGYFGNLAMRSGKMTAALYQPMGRLPRRQTPHLSHSPHADQLS